MPDPLWRQIAEDLRQRIESGDLGKDGEQLPTELELQDHYRASRNTVRDAVKWLVTRGMVYTRSGQGTFIRPRIEQFVTQLSAEAEEGDSYLAAVTIAAVTAEHRTAEVSALRVEIRQADGIIAAELGVPVGSSVVSRHQQRRIDGVPYSLQTSFYPMALVDRGAAHLIRAEGIAEGAVRYIEQALNMRQAGVRDRITARAPDLNEASFFGLPDDGSVVVFEIIRTGFDEDGQPFRITVTTYPADRNQFVTTAGVVPDEGQQAD